MTTPTAPRGKLPRLFGFRCFHKSGEPDGHWIASTVRPLTGGGHEEIFISLSESEELVREARNSELIKLGDIILNMCSKMSVDFQESRLWAFQEFIEIISDQQLKLLEEAPPRPALKLALPSRARGKFDNNQQKRRKNESKQSSKNVEHPY